MEKEKKVSENFTVQGKSLREKILGLANEVKIGKDGFNEFSNYNYFSPDVLFGLVKPLLLKYRIFAHFGAIEQENNITVYVLKLFDLDSDAHEDYDMSVTSITLKGANAIQSKGAQRTYSFRYLLQAALYISNDEDDLDNPKNQEANQKNKDEPRYEKTVKQNYKQKAPEPEPSEEVEDVCSCEKCNNEITGTKTNTVERILEVGQEEFGKQLCKDCIQELRAANKAAKTNKKSEDE